MVHNDTPNEETNQPAPMRGGPGMSGRGVVVTARQAKERRVTLANLIAGGLSFDEISETMHEKFGMTEDAVRALIAKVKAQIVAEYDENSAMHKALASKRIHNHIAGARQARQWSAVANLESQLSKIQGTETPTEAHITVDARLQSAVLHVLGGMSPSQINELVAEELRHTTITTPAQKLVEHSPVSQPDQD